MNYFDEAQHGYLYEAYCDYILTNGDRPITNGDDLILLTEDGYLLQEFVEDYRKRRAWVTTL